MFLFFVMKSWKEMKSTTKTFNCSFSLVCLLLILIIFISKREWINLGNNFANYFYDIWKAMKTFFLVLLLYTSSNVGNNRVKRMKREKRELWIYNHANCRVIVTKNLVCINYGKLSRFRLFTYWEIILKSFWC